MAITSEVTKGTAKPEWKDPFEDLRKKLDAGLLAKRKGIARGLKDLSGRRALTSDLLREARKRAMDAEATEEGFNTFLDREGIRVPKGSESVSEEQGMGNSEDAAMQAAQNVMFQRQYGTGLGTLKAMQDPNYELGSGSALRQPARRIGPASGRFRSAARRLRRQGYGAAAQQMAMAGEMARMSEPSIDTPALRGMRMAQRIVAGREAQKQDRLAAKNPPAPADNRPDLKMPMAYESPLDMTRNRQKLGSTKREGQRI